jgi:hypothetical protein
MGARAVDVVDVHVVAVAARHQLGVMTSDEPQGPATLPVDTRRPLQDWQLDIIVQ